MSFRIRSMRVEDVEAVSRQVEYPAHQDGPLSRLMFPKSKTQPQTHCEDEIKWIADGLFQSLDREEECLHIALEPDESPVGLLGWTSANGSKDTKRQKGVSEPRTMHPPLLDMVAWSDISRRLREERQRVLRPYQQGIRRIVFMSVNPTYQRQGVGSLLLDFFCQDTDRYGFGAFVMASPVSVSFYSKFGFKVVGTVESEEGTFTSMLRAQSPS